MIVIAKCIKYIYSGMAIFVEIATCSNSCLQIGLTALDQALLSSNDAMVAALLDGD